MMVMNLSEQTVKTIYNSLKATWSSLHKQAQDCVLLENEQKLAIIKHQLGEVEDAMMVIEEFLWGE